MLLNISSDYKVLSKCRPHEKTNFSFCTRA